MTRDTTRRDLLRVVGLAAGGLALGGTATAHDSATIGTATLSTRATQLRRTVVQDGQRYRRRADALAAGRFDERSESTAKRVAARDGLNKGDDRDEDTTGGIDGDDTGGTFDRGGVILGYYGRPWSHDERVDSLRWLSDRGMDTFVFAPKDDSYQRANWREPYPDDQFQAFTTEIHVAGERDVDWVPNISPGLPLIPGQPEPGTAPSRDICFTCPEDREVLYRKLDRFFEAGVRTMMVSFDDVQKASSHPEDTATYGIGDENYGRMNRDLLNAIYDRYDAKTEQVDDGTSFTLLTVLADYDGTEDTAYLQGVRSGDGLRDGIRVMWTGTEIVSPHLEAADAAAYASHVGKDRVLVWDNYPVNDYTGGAVGQAKRLFLGPYTGRAPDLPDGVSGILANPMSQSRASRVALGTVAHYLQDPAGYEPEAAWRAAIENEGGAAPDALAAVAENSRSSALDREESPVFVAARDAFLDAYDEGPFWPAAAEGLRAELDRERDAPAVLRDHRPNLAAEMDQFLEQLERNAGAALAGLELLAAQRPTLSATAERRGQFVAVRGIARPPSPETAGAHLRTFSTAYSDTLHDEMVHGDRVMIDLANVYADENRVDAFARTVARRTVEWAPSAGPASQAVGVTVDGDPVEVDDDGRFSTTVTAGTTTIPVVATDGAGGQTGRTIRPE